MLLTKLRNGVELTWDSLDSQERIVMLYIGCWLLVILAGALTRWNRERVRREIREELANSGAAVRS